MDRNSKDNIVSLAEMYAIFFSSAYNKLLEQGIPKSLAHETALEILKQQIISAVKVSQEKNKSIEALMSGIDFKAKGS